MITLRADQQDALDRLRTALAGGSRRVVMQCSTGWGKTVLAGEIAARALAKGNRVMFVVPALSLIDQTVTRFRAHGIDSIGVIQGNHELTNYTHKVQVCSVQTLERRKFPKADVVIIDECHRWFDFYGRWLADPEWRHVPVVGLSATPWTKGLGKHFDTLIVASTTADMIAVGTLSPFVVYAPAHPDLSGVKTVAGDYHEGQLGEVMDKQPLVADIVRSWKELGENRPTLLFAVNRAHAKHCQMQFLDNGIAAEYIDAFTDGDERAEIAKRFHAGETKIVCNVGCLTTGVDWDVRCIIVARPTRSEMLFVQMIGRGLRTAEGKKDCIIIDHSDTHSTLGFVTDITHDTLDDGKKKKKSERKPKEQLPKECPKCAFLRAPKVSKCPNCGFVSQRVSDVEQVDGTLVKLSVGKADKATKERWFRMFLGYAQAKGYKDGWAANKYRDKFSVWPVGLSRVPLAPDSDVLGYIKHSQIKWSKSAPPNKSEAERAAIRADALAKLDALFAK